MGDACAHAVPVKVVPMLEPGVAGYMRSSNMIMLPTNNSYSIPYLHPTPFRLISYVHSFIISYERCTCTLPVKVVPMLEPLMKGYMQSSNMILLTTNNNNFITSLPPTPFIISCERCTCTVPVKVVSMLEPRVRGYMQSSNKTLLSTNNNDFVPMSILPPSSSVMRDAGAQYL